MSNQITWTFTQETANKVIENLRKYRQVDDHIAGIVMQFYVGKEIAAQTLTEVCGQFRADLWNYGAVK